MQQQQKTPEQTLSGQRQFKDKIKDKMKDKFKDKCVNAWTNTQLKLSKG